MQERNAKHIMCSMNCYTAQWGVLFGRLLHTFLGINTHLKHWLPNSNKVNISSGSKFLQIANGKRLFYNKSREK